MKRPGISVIVALLAGCSSSTTSTPPPASSQTPAATAASSQQAPSAASAATASDDGTPAELKALIGARGSSGERGLAQAGYEFRNASHTDTSSMTHWRGQHGTCVAVTTTDGRYASITAVDAAKCTDGRSAVTPSVTAGATRTVCGVIVGGKTNRYLCDVEEHRQGTTVLRFPDSTLRLTWNVGSTSVQVEQEGTARVTVKYADAEGETNFTIDQRTFFYISNPSLAEIEVRNVSQSPHDALIRIDAPGPGVAALGAFTVGSQSMVALSFYHYGDQAAETAARETPRWHAWMQERFPMPAETTQSA